MPQLTYDTVASFSQVTSLLMFMAMFVAVVAYAAWPRNGQRFQRVQIRALDLPQPPARHAANGDGAGASGNAQSQHSRGRQ